MDCTVLLIQLSSPETTLLVELLYCDLIIFDKVWNGISRNRNFLQGDADNGIPFSSQKKKKEGTEENKNIFSIKIMLH